MNSGQKVYNVGIAGAAGYTGGELIRLLLNHPGVTISWAHSSSQAGRPITETHTDLLGETELLFSDAPGKAEETDVVFLCLGHGAARKYLNQYPDLLKTRIIDLSQDYRLGEQALPGVTDATFTYGLCDLRPTEIAQSQYVANPGCFATAIQLALLPLAAAGTLSGKEVHVHATTGSTGAGQQPTDTTHFSWRQNNLSIYKAFAHQHEAEMLRTFRAVQPGEPELFFIPARGSFTRGILATSYVKVEGDLAHWQQVYDSFYADSPFVYLSKHNPDLKQVVNTNKAIIYLEKHRDTFLIISMIDNLLKGASGQAVENMNLMLGLPRTMGLNLKAAAF